MNRTIFFGFLLVAVLALGACSDSNLAGDAKGGVPGKGGADSSFAEYRLESIDTVDYVATFTDLDTGDAKSVSIYPNQTGQFVHDGRTFLMRSVRDQVVSVDVDSDGSFETVVYVDGILELPRYR